MSTRREHAIDVLLGLIVLASSNFRNDPPQARKTALAGASSLLEFIEVDELTAAQARYDALVNSVTGEPPV